MLCRFFDSRIRAASLYVDCMIARIKKRALLLIDY